MFDWISNMFDKIWDIIIFIIANIFGWSLIISFIVLMIIMIRNAFKTKL